MSLPEDIANLLSKPAGEIKAPPPLPPGPYIGIVKSHELLTSPQKQTPFYRFTIDLIAPAEGNEGDFSEIEFPRQLRMDFYLTANSLHRLTDFQCKVLGLSSTMTVMENLALMFGRKAIFNVKLRPSNKQGDDRVYPEIESAAALG
jgi:hypothetical protein